MGVEEIYKYLKENVKWFCGFSLYVGERYDAFEVTVYWNRYSTIRSGLRGSIERALECVVEESRKQKV